jgi:hypothetical protein
MKHVLYAPFISSSSVMVLKIVKWTWANVLEILIIKATRCTAFLKFYFEMKLYMFWTIPLSNTRSFSLYTQRRYVSYRFVDNVQAGSWWISILICLKAVYKPVWHIPLLCVWWETPNVGQRSCPKHVEFHFVIKFEKISASSCFYHKDLSQCMVTWTQK